MADISKVFLVYNASNKRFLNCETNFLSLFLSIYWYVRVCVISRLAASHLSRDSGEIRQVVILDDPPIMTTTNYEGHHKIYLVSLETQHYFSRVHKIKKWHKIYNFMSPVAMNKNV